MKKEKLWTKEFVLTTVVNVVLMLSTFALVVTLASYSIAVYNTSMSTAGLVSSIFIIGALIGRLFAGWKVNHFGSKRLLIYSVVVYVLLMALYFLSLNIVLLLVVRIVQGAAFGIAVNSTATIISQIIPISRSGEGIGIFSTGNVLAIATGPIIGTIIVTNYDYNGMFIFSLVVSVVALILSFFIIAPTVNVENDLNESSFKMSDVIEFRVIPISIVMFLGAFAYSSILSFVTTFADEINLMAISGYFFLAYSVIVLLTRPFSGRLMDTFGENIIIVPAILSFALGMLILSQTTSYIGFILSAIFIGLGYGNFQSITQAIVIKMTPKERMGLANSTYFIFIDTGLGLGPFLLGFAIPIIGFRALYLSFVVFILITLVVYYLLYGKKHKWIKRSVKDTVYEHESV